jgi:flagellar assembly protein FliH
MSNVLPKERQSAYQRWEMNSFGDNRPSAQPPAASAAPKISIEEIARIRDEARTKGHAEGHAEGFADGRAEGLAQGRSEGAAEMDNLRKIAQQLGEEVARADEVIASEVLNLALDLAKAMLKTSLNVRPELIIPIVSEAIRYLPSLQQPALLFLNPADAKVVKTQMHDELDKAGWRVVEDGQVASGGCRIETASNQIDASIDNRWQRLAEALGSNHAWLE